MKIIRAHWYTTLSRGELDIKLTENYYGNEDKYPKYDNFDAINVNKCKDIPLDYYGLMGVPIGIFDKHYLGCFDIVGLFKGGSNALELGAIKKTVLSNNKTINTNCPVVNNKCIYVRVIIKRKSFKQGD